MTTRFQFRELTLYGTREHHTYEFHPGVNLIVGPVGSGKTSILELLKFTLGGDATLSPAVQESVVSTAVRAEVGAQTLVFTRRVGSSTVEAYAAEGNPIGTYATTAGRSAAPVSDLLLTALGIPALRIPRSRTRPTSASSRLTFFDVYAYLYLGQTEIDRSVVAHLDSYRDPKRRATFELLYGLSDATLMDLQVQRGELREALAQEIRRAAEIRSFLTAAEQPGLDAARRERDRLVAAVEASHVRLRALQADSRAATSDADPIRDRLGALEEMRASVRQRLADSSLSYETLKSLVAQLEIDKQRIEKSLAAETVLSGLEFTICPRCLQTLSGDRAPAGDCYVCLQREDPGDARERLAEESRRVEEQRKETLDLQEEDEAELARARAHMAELDERVAEARAELDQATSQYVSPRFAEVQDAGADVGRLEARFAALDSVLRLWHQFGELEAHGRDLQTRLSSVDGLIAEARASLSAGLERVGTLSDLFAETLVQFQLPWLESASIDRATYLPIVNARSFEELSSGGMKALVNDAYHLAALRYALVYADSLMPLLQVIDSPRKNLGSGPDDLLLAENLSRRIRALQDAFGDGFQMILADNDLPGIAAEFRSITLGYETPGVPFARHPGPDQVQSIGAPA